MSDIIELHKIGEYNLDRPSEMILREIMDELVNLREELDKIKSDVKDATMWTVRFR